MGKRDDGDELTIEEKRKLVREFNRKPGKFIKSVARGITNSEDFPNVTFGGPDGKAMRDIMRNIVLYTCADAFTAGQVFAGIQHDLDEHDLANPGEAHHVES